MRVLARAPVLTIAWLTACSAGPPPGYSGGPGDHWTFPLIGPLEDGLILTPLSIGGRGPYVFALDPDAPMTVVEGSVVKEAELRAYHGPPRLDESNTLRPRIYAEAISIELGDLVIERREVIVVKNHTFDAAGRRIHGVIGRDVLFDDLVFGFDRDHGLGLVMTKRVFKPSAQAVAVKFEQLRSRLASAEHALPARRRIMARIGPPDPAPGPDVGTAPPASLDEVAMHIDLGATASQLRPTLWQAAGMASSDAKGLVVDEIGSPRAITSVGRASVSVGDVRSGSVGFLPYAEQRWGEHEIAGTLGLGFFALFNIWLDSYANTLYLQPRTAIELAPRLTRWDIGAIRSCRQPGCILFRVIDPLADTPVAPGKPHPGLVLSIAREPVAGGMGLEVLLEARGPTGARLPRLAVNLPPHIDRLVHRLGPEYLGVTLHVTDASPFPRDCPSSQGCVDTLQ